MVLYGAYEAEPSLPGAPRPAYGHSKDGRGELKQVLLRLGVSGDGGLPLGRGLWDGNTSDRVETPVAIAEGLALGLERGWAWCPSCHAPVWCAKSWQPGDSSNPPCPSSWQSLGRPRTKRAASGMGKASFGLWRSRIAMGG